MPIIFWGLVIALIISAFVAPPWILAIRMLRLRKRAEADAERAAQAARIETVLDYFTRLFSRFAVRIETIPDEPELVGIGVYGVPRDEMAWIRKAIGDAEDELFAGFGLGLIPMIRSRETTAKHYPNLIDRR